MWWRIFLQWLFLLRGHWEREYSKAVHRWIVTRSDYEVYFQRTILSTPTDTTYQFIYENNNIKQQTYMHLLTYYKRWSLSFTVQQGKQIELISTSVTVWIICIKAIPIWFVVLLSLKHFYLCFIFSHILWAYEKGSLVPNLESL